MAADPVVERRPQGGFTLIEVMVALLLTALTVIGVLGLFRVETRASAFSRRETEAAVLAQDKLEELRTNVVPTTGNTENITDPLTGASLFTREWAITTSSDITRITVTVTWDENGVSREVIVNGTRGSS